MLSVPGSGAVAALRPLGLLFALGWLPPADDAPFHHLVLELEEIAQEIHHPLDRLHRLLGVLALAEATLGLGQLLKLIVSRRETEVYFIKILGLDQPFYFGELIPGIVFGSYLWSGFSHKCLIL